MAVKKINVGQGKIKSVSYKTTYLKRNVNKSRYGKVPQTARNRL